jgi:serine/threonine-protein kinase HipA
MIFKNLKSTNDTFVWIWLPGKINPIVVGQISKEDGIYSFHYGQSYLENTEAIALSPLELPLRSGNFIPEGIHNIHSCLRDAAPDAWGRRLIDYQYSAMNPNELDYMLLSGSNRIGALDFQASSTEYKSREIKNIHLEDFIKVAELIEKNQPIAAELAPLLMRGTSIGGARPKAIIYDDHTGFIAKFGLSTDTYNIIKAEYISMRLAKLAGINVAEVKLHSIVDKNVLLVKRFDRYHVENGIARRLMLSGLSLLGLNEMEARYASYMDLADMIRHKFVEHKQNLQELYKRLVFNVLIGNTGDHARNTSAFWDGKALTLTPAYDICPQMRVGQIATQAMAINGIEGNYSTLRNVLSISESFQISPSDAENLIEKMLADIEGLWTKVCEEADLQVTEREMLWGKIVFNAFCFQGWKE